MAGYCTKCGISSASEKLDGRSRLALVAEPECKLAKNAPNDSEKEDRGVEDVCESKQETRDEMIPAIRG